MPMKNVKSVLTNQVDQDIIKHANDPISYGNLRLPAGVKGIAQLDEMYFGVHQDGANKGNIYFRATGTVIEPEIVTVDGSPMVIRGLQTSIILPWNYARGNKTVEDSKVAVLNTIRQLGGPNCLDHVQTGKQLEEVVQHLSQQTIYFRFSTTQSNPPIDPETGKPQINPRTGKPYEPRIWENWHGTKGLTNYQPVQKFEVVDQTQVLDQTQVVENAIDEVESSPVLDSELRSPEGESFHDNELVEDHYQEEILDTMEEMLNYQESEATNSIEVGKIVRYHQGRGAPLLCRVTTVNADGTLEVQSIRQPDKVYDKVPVNSVQIVT